LTPNLAPDPGKSSRDKAVRLLDRLFDARRKRRNRKGAKVAKDCAFFKKTFFAGLAVESFIWWRPEKRRNRETSKGLKRNPWMTIAAVEQVDASMCWPRPGGLDWLIGRIGDGMKGRDRSFGATGHGGRRIARNPRWTKRVLQPYIETCHLCRSNTEDAQRRADYPRRD